MSIPSDQLSLIIKNTTLALAQSRPVIRSTYRIIAPTFDALVAEASFDANIDRFDQFEEKDADVFSRAFSWFISVKEWHRAQDALDGYSFHDVSLSLKDWTFSKPGNLWTISHPISGEFTGIKISVVEGRPTLRGRFDAVLAHVPPPSVWGWAISDSPEDLTVHCREVVGANSYNVYADLGSRRYALLGNVPDHNLRTISVPAGYYRVCIAAVISGRIGALGNENQVQVEAIMAQADPLTALLVTPQSKKKSRVAEWIRSWRKT